MEGSLEEEKQMRRVWVLPGSYHEPVARPNGMGLAGDGVMLVMGLIIFGAPNQGLNSHFVVAPPDWL